ncbi:hypothetical protein RND71_028433 [Anisodus tanguticus]|uniref:Gnk2-homologous domain-containing protein n=1 Tax=Anisodus tanguticus TaxID=243964 RepID=A0AAE1VA19_9SOLA|nr:hypothetical protein RND71_028433 [Anisodus tanguticus]
MVSAIVLCRGDVDLKQCRTCVNNIAQKLVCSCPNKKEAFGEYDESAYGDPLGKYATDQAIDQTIYALVQCTPDLSPQDCLTDSYGAMATCPCNGN